GGGGAPPLPRWRGVVDTSWVPGVARAPRRYRLLETIRTYAADRLVAAGGDPVARQRHSAHYLSLAETAAEELRTPRQREAFDRLTAELPNLRTALAHTIATNDVESVWRWVAALQRFCDIGGHRREVEEWIRQAL